MRVAWVLVVAVPLPALVAQATWSQAPVTGPVARYAALSVYDTQRQVVVLFGGASSSNQRLYDHWEWDGSSWSLRVANIGFETYFCSAAYDSGRNRIVVLDQLGWTHEFDGTNWQVVSTTGPRTERAVMAYDVHRARTVLFTGGNEQQVRSDTWEWDGTTWQQRNSGGPIPRYFSAMIYHPGRRECLLFGGLAIGALANDLWAWNGSYWRDVTPTGTLPPHRSSHSMSYDSVRHRLVLYGGNGGHLGDLNDTWEHDGTTWTRITTANTPSTKRWCAMSFDEARATTMLFGGSRDGSPSGAEADTMLYVPPSTGVAVYQPFGTGCGGPAGVPTLQNVNGSRPVMGGNLQLQLSNLPPSLVAAPFGITSLSNTNWNGLSLPLALDSIGMTGCQAWVAPTVTDLLQNQGGIANWSIPIPALPGLSGFRFYVQGAVLAPGANTAGILVSNAGSGEVGAL